MGLGTAFLVVVVTGVGLAAADSSAEVPADRCLGCHSHFAIDMLPIQFAEEEGVSAYVDRDAFLQSAHRGLACFECHPNYHPTPENPGHPSLVFPSRREYAAAIDRECRRCHQSGHETGARQVAELLHSTLAEGTPLCSDCHDAHAMTLGTTSHSMAKNCVRCHQEIYTTFAASVHGSSLDEIENLDVPACTSCHIGHLGGGKSQASLRMRAGYPCMGCHGDQQLMAKYELPTDVVDTYLNDFHGVSVSFYEEGELGTARDPMVCSDCHGIHNVARTEPSADMKVAVLDACRKCHENAAENFPDAWLGHRQPSLTSNVLVFAVRAGYWMLIPFVITGLILHISFHLIVFPIRKRLRGETTHEHTAHQPAPDVPSHLFRFTVRQRLEHLIVMVTFFILVITGLPQKFHDAAWAHQLVSFLGGIENVRQWHRVAGVAMTIASVIHVVFVSASFVFGRTKLTMVPTKKDFFDTIGTVKYYLGFAHELPKADRFDYRQKFEYWGMILGTIIMVATGFMLMYPLLPAKYLPGQLLAVARVAHSYEAMMALLTIVIWHMYGGFDWCIFTGKMAAHRLAHHHPLEYERLVREHRRTQQASSLLPAATTPVPVGDPELLSVE